MPLRKRNPEERKRAMKKYRQNHKAKLAIKAKEYREKNPDVYGKAAAKYYRKYRAKVFAKRYGVTEAEIKALPTACEICNSQEKLCVDHNHLTNKLRGILCNNCNLLLGYFLEDAQRVFNAMHYLIRKDGNVGQHDIAGYAKLVADTLESPCEPVQNDTRDHRIV